MTTLADQQTISDPASMGDDSLPCRVGDHREGVSAQARVGTPSPRAGWGVNTAAGASVGDNRVPVRLGAAMGDIDLEAIKVRTEAATPGPWRAEFEHGDGEPFGRHWTYVTGVSGKPGVDDSVWVFRFDDDYGTDQTSDAEFIAHAREDIPALIAEVRRLREALR